MKICTEIKQENTPKPFVKGNLYQCIKEGLYKGQLYIYTGTGLGVRLGDGTAGCSMCSREIFKDVTDNYCLQQIKPDL